MFLWRTEVLSSEDIRAQWYNWVPVLLVEVSIGPRVENLDRWVAWWRHDSELGFGLKRLHKVVASAQTIKLKTSNASDACQSNAVSSVLVFSPSVLQLGKFLITSSSSSMISSFGGTQLLLSPFWFLFTLLVTSSLSGSLKMNFQQEVN